MTTRQKSAEVDEKDIKVHIESEKDYGTKNSSQKENSSRTKLGQGSGGKIG